MSYYNDAMNYADSIESLGHSHQNPETGVIEKAIFDFPAPETQWLAVWSDGKWLHDEDVTVHHERKHGRYFRLAVPARLEDWEIRDLLRKKI